MDETRRSLDRPILALYAPRHKSPWIGTSFSRPKSSQNAAAAFAPAAETIELQFEPMRTDAG
jgi:hypothetical protein